MKLTIVLLTITFFSVQATSIAQNVTITGRNLTLQQVFSAIKKQTGYVVFSNKRDVDETQTIRLSPSSLPLTTLLDSIFRDQPLKYSIKGKTIVVSRKLPALSSSQVVFADQSAPPVSIRIVDSLGMPLPGVSVSLKRSRSLGVTDANGVFTADVNVGDVLVFSSIGFQTIERTVADNSPITIRLIPAVTKLADIEVMVNTGYQTLSRERATGSFSTISGKRLDAKLRPDLKAALEGQAAGVVITKEGNVEIRGVSTFSAGIREPLIVVDGFPISGGLETINIDNIENITVLKDAVAASIYGARSSNGVIIVTTKQAARGRMQVSYKGSLGVTLKPSLSYLNRTSAADYVDAELDLYNQDPNSFLNSYNTYNSNLSTVNYLSVIRSLNMITQQDYDQQIATLKTQNGIDQMEKYLFRNQLTQQHNIALSGGSEKSTLNAAVKFITNDNNTIYNGDSRLIVDVKDDWKLSNRINVQLISNVNYFRSSAPQRTWTELLGYESYALIQPYDLIVDPATGQPQDILGANPNKIQRYANISGLRPMNYNPLADLPLETRKVSGLQVRMGGNIRINLLKGLNLEGGGTYTTGSTLDRSLSSRNSFRVRLGYNDATSVSNSTKHYIPDGDMINESRNMNEAYVLRAQLTYNNSFGPHRLSLLAGNEIRKDVVDNNAYPTRFGYNDQAGIFAPFNYSDYNAGLYNTDMLGTIRPTASNGSYSFSDNRFVSYYANGSYEYDNRFLVSGSIRMDLTNFFGTDSRYRYKPLWSVGGTYKLSNEKFFDVSWLDRLHLRASYGLNGNISLNNGPFLIIAAGAFMPAVGATTYSISSPPNNSLRWERTNTINLGTDLTIKKQVHVSVDYYLRKSTDLLASDPMDGTRGFSSVVRNVGQINNQGIEASVNADLIKRRGLVWNVLFNMSYNKNTVKKYNFNYTATSLLTSASISREGYPANSIFAYQFAGLDNNGIAQFYNNSKQKVVGGNVQPADLVHAGTLRPKFMYDLTNAIRYNSWELSFMIVARMGHVLRMDTFTGSNYNNNNVAKRWRKPGDEATTIYPKLAAWNNDLLYFPYSDTFIESANFLKLRDVSLTYDINPSFTRKAGIANARICVQARNLFMITANSDHRDPETSEINVSGITGQFYDQGYTSLPLRPEFHVGLTIGF